MTETRAEPVAETEIDWERCRRFLRDTIRRRVHGVRTDMLEDLTQEALIRTLRAVRTSPADNLDALMTSIAGRTGIDYIRRLKILRLLYGVELGDDIVEGLAAPREAPIGDSLERFRFIVTEFFVAVGSPCRELVAMFFDEINWQQAAERLGRNRNQVAQQWKRCVDRLRLWVRMNPGSFAEWTES